MAFQAGERVGVSARPHGDDGLPVSAVVAEFQQAVAGFSSDDADLGADLTAEFQQAVIDIRNYLHDFGRAAEQRLAALKTATKP